ncbi:MAG: DUF3685 domain-containing protein [Elainellaceae cyanobacterium]
MTTLFPDAPAQRPLRVAVIDDDVIFRGGLCVWLEAQGITVLFQDSDFLAAQSPEASQVRPDVVLYGFNQGPAAVRSVVQALEALMAAPVLGLGPADTAVALRGQQAGARGYWVKGHKPQTLLTAVRQVASGAEAWSIPYWQSTPKPTTDPLGRWRRRLYASGISQIEAAIADLEAQLAVDLPLLDRAVLAGHRRELKAARGLVSWLLAPRLAASDGAEADYAVRDSFTSDSFISDNLNRSNLGADGERISGVSPRRSPAVEGSTTALDRSPSGSTAVASEIVPGGIQATLFETLETKLQSPLRNQTRRPLEIDILRESCRRELLYQVLRSLELLLAELRQASEPAQILEQRPRLLVDLWQNALTEFFGKYYVVPIDGVELEVVPYLMREANQVRPALESIVGVTDLWSHLLFQTPLRVDGVSHNAGTAVAMARAEHLLDNLVVRVANTVVQPMLNQLGDVEMIKQRFYSRRLISSRDVAQFRNELSWHYRLVNALYEPLDIFESQIRLLHLGAVGIEEQVVYASRRTELEQLGGLPFGLTLLLELRDALAPRFQALVSWAGKLVVYVLTEVLGRAIGLVGRGVLRGIGSAWQDVRVSREISKGTVSDPRR